MKIVIIEDEIPAQRLLKKYILDLHPNYEIIGVFGNVSESVCWLNQNPSPDIIFLDVQLTDGLGFNILEQIKINSFIIFTTAYDQYAIQAFKNNAVDYLLKPIKIEELEEAFLKLDSKKNLFQRAILKDLHLSISNNIYESKQYRERFLVSGSNNWYTLNVSEIAYFYIESEVCYAVTFNKKKHPLNLRIGNIMEDLNPSVFFRTNRQTIININAIKKVENWFGGKLVVVTDPKHHERIVVSRLNAVEFRDVWLNR
ncbi:LytR/AlgR family response regulator transcription factor [Sunxiuqinia elliptica]|uniref:Two component transcriptional regulator, LytTR family n=1 Tax=Sunxiuqinia elliptica TaxID=655355 RepID=A0A1I2D5I4_9BACT|nr:LytTR family DNA-binding domain-containing protein [Sunxiuqinia elliptica]SFE75797.1 two component transcriptional regulator, LytTR family [Sunxiuqinia elliptica]